MSHTTDILLVTINRNETKAVLQVFEAATQHASTVFNEGDHAYHHLGTLNGVNLVLVQAEMGGIGLGATLPTVEQSIRALSPQAVIMIGVAFGMKTDSSTENEPGAQAIGQVLVATRLMAYDCRRVGTGKDGKVLVIPRGARVDVSTKLLNHLRTAEVIRKEETPKVSFGLLMSGEVLVDNLEFREELKKIEPEAIGGEMEGAGLYAACQSAKVDWILVKGICDWGDGHKKQDKDAKQMLAAQNAANFVAKALQVGTPYKVRAALHKEGKRLQPSNERALITITLHTKFENFSRRILGYIIGLVAELAGIKEDQIEVISIEDGSIIIYLGMHESSAATLKFVLSHAFENLCFRDGNLEMRNESSADHGVMANTHIVAALIREEMDGIEIRTLSLQAIFNVDRIRRETSSDENSATPAVMQRLKR